MITAVAALATITPLTVVSSASASAPDDAGPIVIEHRWGTTTLDVPPQRIVSLDPQWNDILFALDAPVVATAKSSYTDSGIFDWQTLPAGTELIESDMQELPFEAIAAFEPDLIVITYFAQDESDYQRLAEIAPTIGPISDAAVDDWRDIAAAAGQVVGDPAAVDEMIAEHDELIASIREDLPGLDGLVYDFVNYVPGDKLYIVADPNDGASQFFASIGLSLDPDKVGRAADTFGRLELSFELVDQLDGDVLIVLANGGDPFELPGFDSLPAVESGAYVEIDVQVATALNTPSPQSLAFAIDTISPALEAAAG